MKHLIFLLMVLTVIPTAAHGQDRDSLLMQYIIDDRGDTVYLDNIEPVVKTARRKGKEWRRYYRLVHNFAKAYPYALLAEEKLSEADSTITTDARQAQPLYQHPPERAVRDIRKTAEESYGQPGQTAAEADRPADRYHAIRDHQRVQGTGGGGFLAGHRQAVRLGHETALRPGRSRQADRGTGDPLSERGVQCPVPLRIRTESARAGGQVPAGRGAALISSRSPSKTAYSPPSTQHPRMTIRPPEGMSISPGVW